MNIAIIAALTKSKIIGVSTSNSLPWKIPAELQHFKKLTLNKAIIMGSTTFKALNCKPLPKRHNIILTKNPEQFAEYFNKENLSFVDNIENSIKQAEKFSYQEIMVIGGREIYKQFLGLGLANKMYLSIIKDDYKGDVYFPEFDSKDWVLQSCEEHEEFVSQVLVINTAKYK